MNSEHGELVGANGQAVVHLQIAGRTVEVDVEIADLVKLLNDGGFPTRACCSGHGLRPGSIVLMDGRELIIARNHAEARQIESLSLRMREKHEALAELVKRFDMRDWVLSGDDSKALFHARAALNR